MPIFALAEVDYRVLLSYWLSECLTQIHFARVTIMERETMATDWIKYAKDVEAQISQIKEDIAALESGKMELRENTGSGWRNISNEWIQRHKANLATYEAILKDIREKRI